MTRPSDDFLRLLGFAVKAAAARPYRARAEMFAVRDGQVYGGLYENGTFGVFGGGIDDGEDPLQAAVREFGEEAGYAVTNPRLIVPDPYDFDWKPPYRSAKQARRAEKYRGSRTYYVAGDLGDQVAPTPPDAAKRRDVRLYPIADATRLARLPGVADDGDVAAHRQRVLRLLAQSLTPGSARPAGPVDKAAAAGYPPSRQDDRHVGRDAVLESVAALVASRR